ncbi:hypothetical protein ANCCAN_02898 [Ancylostoma caninum]|uniref:Uncharacterized protein n=1 Tax=Ancylostoma caninum TaxID=29170 RepID=A0A368H6I5_ANCCA|nr:hypothetical protein ANCCAN_02898 [Ancylostoma caninum]
MYKNEESYLSIRLMLLGALGAKAYQKMWSSKENVIGVTDPVDPVTDTASPTPRSEVCC